MAALVGSAHNRLHVEIVASALERSTFGCLSLLSELQRPVRRRKHKRLIEQEFHHNVYVVLLSKVALKDLSILRRNPERDPSKPAVTSG